MHHFILRCTHFRAQRNQHLAPLGLPARSLPTLLSQPTLLPALFKYVHATGRFKKEFGELQEIEAPKTRKPARLKTDNAKHKPNRQDGAGNTLRQQTLTEVTSRYTPLL